MAIDIKKLNQEYTKEKSILARLNAPGGLNDRIEQMELDLHDLDNSLIKKQNNLKFAQLKNNISEQKRLQKEIDDIKKQVAQLNEKFNKAKEFLNKQQEKVDAKFAELSKDPETKKKLDSILYKKYNSKIKAEINKKKQLQTIKEIADNHPYVKNLLKGIESCNKMITQYNRIINTYNKLSTKSPLDPKEKATLARVTAELPKATANLPIVNLRLADRQADLKAYLMKNHPEMAKTFIFNNKPENQKKFDEFINGIHSYDDLDRQSVGADKTIANCTKAMNGLTVSQELKNFANPDSTLPVMAENKPSWLHPIKRIKYNINARKARKAAEAQSEESRNEQRKAFKDELKLSKDEYESKIVQKYLESYDKGLHEAAKSNRNNSDGSR